MDSRDQQVRTAARPTVVLDVPPELAAERRESRGDAAQLYDRSEVQHELAAFYKGLGKHMPGDRIAVIGGVGTVDEVHARVWDTYVRAFAE